MVRSKNEIEVVETSYVYFILGWYSFSSEKNSRKLSFELGQIRKMSSINLIRSVGFGVPLSVIVSRNSSSMPGMKRFANVGAHFVPMATPCFCLYVRPLNSKWLCFKTVLIKKLAIDCGMYVGSGVE